LETELLNRAEKVIPGGVNSPVRAFAGVGGTPVFMQSSEGPYLIDVNGKKYIDYVCSWGPVILGHNNSIIREAVTSAVANGLSFGTSSAREVMLAEQITAIMPGMEMVRMTNSGTEATMSAIRLARGYTNKNKIIKFIGCYHGHTDSLLVKAGSGGLTFTVPDSAGIPAGVAQETLVAHYNDLAAVQQLFNSYADDIAAVIVEPIAANMNLVLPEPNFLTGLQNLCQKHSSVLIFDEVMTGFRVSLSGAAGLYGITPDLYCLGKIIGGGLPVGAFGGRKEIMSKLAPLGPVYQAGTLSGNPVTMAAGLANIEQLKQPGVYDKLSKLTGYITDGLMSIAYSNNTPFQAEAVGGLFGFSFASTKLSNYLDVKEMNTNLYNKFFHGMLAKGVYLPPSAYEACFLTLEHDEDILEKTLNYADEVLREIL